jgi:hypothetical protein
MLFLIKDGALVGTSTEFTDSLPEGFSLIEGPDLPLFEVYWDGHTVSAKPPQPTPEHYWDSEINTWVAPVPIIIPQIQDWDKLISLLDNSPEWGKVYTAAEKTLKANAAFTTLLTTLTNFRKVETLEFAIAKLRGSLIGISGVGDFTTEEIASINQKLTDCGFDLQLS